MYNKTEWQDHIIDTVNDEVIQEGTRFTAARMNNIENGIAAAHDDNETQERKIKRLETQLAISSRAGGSSNVLFDLMDGNAPNLMVIDTAKADVTEAVAAAGTELPVDNIVGFKPWTQVTIFDDENYEEVVIAAVNENSLTVSALVNSYKKGAVIARTTAVRDTENAEMLIGTWGTYDISVVEGV